MNRIILLSIFLLAAVNGKAQTPLYVDSAVSSSGAGTSWGTAYKTLNEALIFVNAASTTILYEVNVAKGTYYPTGLQTGTNRDSTFLIARGGVKLYGGYPNGGGTRNAATNPTILSGNIGSAATNADNSHHVIVASNIAAASNPILVDGFTLTGGNANGSGNKTYNLISIPRLYGGAFLQQAVANSVTITACTIVNNKATSSGGGVYVDNGVLAINSTTFSADTITSATGGGGAIHANSTNLTIVDCGFSLNYSGDEGGAISTNDARLIINQCDFVSNRAGGHGGALYHFRTSLSGQATTVGYSTFTGNQAVSSGGAIYDATDNSSSTSYPSTSIQYNTFTGNTAGIGGAVLANNVSGLGNPGYIKGCTFTGNLSTSTGGGGAINASSSYGTFGIDSNYIGSNKAAGNGGGLYMYGTTSVTRTIFTNDSAVLGGAIYRNGGTVANCRIVSNFATHGGAIYSTSFTGTDVIRNDTISGNRAAGNGGALFNYGADPIISNVLISGNVAGNRGGAIYDSSSASPTITNCTLVGDTAGNTNGIYNTNSSSPTILNTIIWEGNTNSINNFINSFPVVTYTTVQGGYTGTGNLSTDPMFISPVTPTGIPTTNGSYAVLPCSPTVNTGLNSGSYTGILDLAGSSRLFGATVDRGAYEYQNTFPAPITGNSAVCVNATLQLAHIVSGGTWVSSNPAAATVSATGLVTGLVAGTTTITYTYTSGPCPGAPTKVITVSSLPTVGVINGSSTLCTGTNALMTITPGGGVWSSSNTALATITTGGNVTPLAPGLDTIRYTVTNASGCVSVAIKPVTINASPVVPPITGPSFVCTNSPIQLSNTLSGGTWSSSNSSYAWVSSTGVVTALASSGVDIYYTVGNAAGCSTTVTKTLNIYGPPFTPTMFPQGSSTICVNGTRQFYSNPTTGAWSTDAPGVATVSASGLVTGTGPGTATITYTVNNTACSSSASHQINVVSAFSTNLAATICPGASYTFYSQTLTSAGVYTENFTAQGGCDSAVNLTLGITPLNLSVTQAGPALTSGHSGGSYVWVDCNDNYQVAPFNTYAQTFTAQQNGSYAVIVSQGSCTDTSACYPVTGLGLGTTGRSQSVQVFPNPASNFFTVQTGKVVADRIVVRDISGRSLLQQTPAGNSSTFSLEGLAAGLYMVEVYSDGFKETVRVTVTR